MTSLSLFDEKQAAGCCGSLLSLAVAHKGRLRTVLLMDISVVPVPAEPQPRLIDHHAEVAVVGGMVTVDDMRPRVIMAMISVVALVLFVMFVRLVTIVTGMETFSFAVKVAIDALAPVAHAIRFIVLAPGFRTVSFVFKAMLNPVPLAVQMSFNALTFGVIAIPVPPVVAAVSECHCCDQ